MSSIPHRGVAQDCASHIAKDHPSVAVDIVYFERPRGGCNAEAANVLDFASFAMAIFAKEAKGSAMMFWINVGGGITTRHATFSKE